MKKARQKTFKKAIKKFSRAKVLLVAILLIALSAVGTKVVSDYKNPSQTACRQQSPLNVCIEIKTHKVTASEDVSMVMKLTNQTSDYTEQFNSGCNGPDVVINGRNINEPRVCTTALSAVGINGKSTKKYDLKFSAAYLKEGPNDVAAVWGDFKTPEINIVRLPITAAESAKQFEACQKNTPPSYCTSLTVLTINYAWTCDHWKEVLKVKGFSVKCSSLMDVGGAAVFVPILEKDKYANILRKIPEIQSVNGR